MDLRVAYAAVESRPSHYSRPVPNRLTVPPTVPPFHAMAMNLAAERRSAQGLDVIHLEVGQPATGAPRRRSPPSEARSTTARLHQRAGTAAAPTPARRALPRAARRRDRPRRGVVVAGRVGRLHARLPRRVRRRRRGSASSSPATRATATCCSRSAWSRCRSSSAPRPDGRRRPSCSTPAGPLDGLVVATPSNPTGTVLDAEPARQLVRHCDEHGMRLVADEIYHGITYGGRHRRRSPRPTRAIVVNSFSKYFSMTGWRLGWMVVPDDLAGRSSGCSRTCTSARPTCRRSPASARSTRPPSSTATSRATATTARADRRPRGRRPRPHRVADGAFYVYADVSHLTATSASTRSPVPPLADEIGVATTPGSTSTWPRRRFVRFSYAGTGADDPSMRAHRTMARRGTWTAIGRRCGAPRHRPVDGARRPELRALPGRLRRRRHQGRAARRRQPAPHGVARPTRRRRPVVEARQPQQAHDRRST